MASLSNFRISLVAVPLGHIDDLSTRARERLAHATRIFCEDTRKLRELAQRAGIELKAQITPLPGDAERDYDWKRLLPRDGESAHWVLVSDAGTPIVNDPGRALLHFAQKESIEVEAVPGPSAPILAWQWSGGFGLPFVFAGFAPKVKNATSKDLAQFFEGLEHCSSFCFFDSRHQVLTTLDFFVGSGRGETRMFIAREMTKPHEELLEGTAVELRSRLEERINSNEGVGELTLIVQGALAHGARPQAAQASSWSSDELAKIRSLPPKAAAKLGAEKTGLEVSEIYKAFAEARDQQKGDSDR